MSAHPPIIGEWYRLRNAGLFEVVAFDEADGAVELQYFDGTVEEIDLLDWSAQVGSGAIVEADAPDDSSGAGDQDPDDERARPESFSGEQQLNASGLDELDLFE
ncbi:MAG TPA: DUF6763 family protein [Steroidobacteraceae bacterium]